jgi:uncharacterized membrane protein
MSSPVERFWDQYRDNVQHARRNAKYKFARLGWAALVTIIVAPLCYAVRNLTGSPTLAAAFGVAGAVGGLIVWWIIESLWRAASDRHEPAVQAEIIQASPAESAPADAGVAPSPAAQSFAPAQPAARSGGGMGLALAGLVAVLALSCCGGGIVLVSVGSYWLAAQKAPADPAPIGFGPAPPPRFPRPPSPFDELQREHEKRLDELRRQPR